MFKSGILLLCSLAILVSGDDKVTSPARTIPDSISTTNSTPTTITSSTSQILNNTTLAPTTTTTTSPIPNNTTLAPTTTTTTPNPSPPPTPGPPETGKWLINGTNVTCIIAKMALQFDVTYVTSDNKTVHRTLNLPRENETSADGVCGTGAVLEQNMTIRWNSSIASTEMNNLTLHFLGNITKYQWALHHLEVEFAREEFPGIKNNYSTKFVHLIDEFSTGFNNSYRCLKDQKLNLTSLDNKTSGVVYTSNLQFQAFHVQDSTSFGYAEDCAFDTPDIVPIAVGCALAILVVIVLAAYLVGRRRSQARGYLSM